MQHGVLHFWHRHATILTLTALSMCMCLCLSSLATTRTSVSRSMHRLAQVTFWRIQIGRLDILFHSIAYLMTAKFVVPEESRLVRAPDRAADYIKETWLRFHQRSFSPSTMARILPTPVSALLWLAAFLTVVPNIALAKYKSSSSSRTCFDQ